MRQEIYLDEINYSELKQATEIQACQRITNEVFADYYHNVSYFVPTDITDKWSVINYVAKLLAKDLAD
jgi:hypothetical protein